ncbi:unnamed protein product, partial [Ectocarpus fasciculatus]
PPQNRRSYVRSTKPLSHKQIGFALVWATHDREIESCAAVPFSCSQERLCAATPKKGVDPGSLLILPLPPKAQKAPPHGGPAESLQAIQQAPVWVSCSISMDDSGSAAEPMDQDQQDRFPPVAGSRSPPVSPIGSLGGSLDGILDDLENLDDDGIALEIDENGNVVLNPTEW